MNILIIFFAKYVIFLSIILFFCISILFLGRYKEKRVAYLFSCLSFPLSFLVAMLLSLFIKDPRPFIVEHTKPLIAHAADNGFPSDHMLLAMVIASIIFIYNRKLGIILIIVAILIGAARVLAGVHHLVDILGSSIIASGVTSLLYFFQTRHKSS